MADTIAFHSKQKAQRIASRERRHIFTVTAEGLASLETETEKERRKKKTGVFVWKSEDVARCSPPHSRTLTGEAGLDVTG